MAPCEHSGEWQGGGLMSQRCPVKGAGGGTSNQHSSPPCRSWHGNVSSQRKDRFFFALYAIGLPDSPGEGACSKSQRGEVLTRGGPGGW